MKILHLIACYFPLMILFFLMIVGHDRGRFDFWNDINYSVRDFLEQFLMILAIAVVCSLLAFGCSSESIKRLEESALQTLERGSSQLFVGPKKEEAPPILGPVSPLQYTPQQQFLSNPYLTPTPEEKEEEKGFFRSLFGN